jgi:2-polyprenyl-3-methyl-5-hydroxy-6-metoxy-1,4-benzoquinol methylase
VTRQELNQWLPVDGRSFLRLGNYANRKRLHRALRLGVTVRLLEPADYGTAYDAVADNRRKKGRTLSMAWEDVQQLAAAFPHQLRMFGAFMAGSMIAAAICLQVRHDILYVYAWGEREGAEAASPVTVLARSIHDFASALGLTMVDLGTSSIDGVVNQGLAAFKRSLGAEASLKLWLHKTARASQPNLTAPSAAPCDYSASYDPETDFDRWYTTLTARRIAAELRPGQAVLELGSATGLLTSTLAGEGRRIVCVERAAAYVARAHARNLPGVEIRHEDATTFTPEGVFDHVLAINVLHELPDPSPVIRHLRDCLAPSGLLHVTLPNPRSLHRLSALAAGMITTLDAVSERGGAFGTLRLQGADEVASSMAALGLREIRRAGVLVKPLPNAAMASLSDEIIEAYDALAADLPGHGAMTYQVFARA